jgi:hypothetical protein
MHIKKGTSTSHPENPFFKKYSNNLSQEDHKNIHSNILKSEEVIRKRKKGWNDFFNDNIKKEKWKANMKFTHNNIEHPWLTNISPEERIRRNKKSSIAQKNNILEGKFIPQNNYRTKRRFPCYINNKEFLFRSSWEICFFLSHPNLNYEKLRIPYELENEQKIYIPDFIDYENKILYELKPKRQYIAQVNKMNSAIKWCLDNQYKFIWINESNILNFIDKEVFNDERNLLFYNKMLIGVEK